MSKPTIDELQAAADYHNAQARLADLVETLTDADLTPAKVEKTIADIKNMLTPIRLNVEAMIKVSEARSGSPQCETCERTGLALGADDLFRVCECLKTPRICPDCNPFTRCSTCEP